MNRKFLYIATTTLIFTIILGTQSSMAEEKGNISPSCRSQILPGIPSGGAIVDLMVCTLENISKTDQKIESISIKKDGLHDNHDIDKVWMNNEQFERVSNTKSFTFKENTTVVDIFPEYQLIKAGESVTWTLKVGFADSDLQGRTFIFQIDSIQSQATESQHWWAKVYRWMVK